MNTQEITPSCQLLTCRDVSRLLRIHIRSVWRSAALAEAGKGDFPIPVWLGPKTIRWKLQDIEAYLDRIAGKDTP